eukprot:468175_1
MNGWWHNESIYSMGSAHVLPYVMMGKLLWTRNAIDQSLPLCLFKASVCDVKGSAIEWNTTQTQRNDHRAMETNVMSCYTKARQLIVCVCHVVFQIAICIMIYLIRIVLADTLQKKKY